MYEWMPFMNVMLLLFICRIHEWVRIATVEYDILVQGFLLLIDSTGYCLTTRVVQGCTSVSSVEGSCGWSKSERGREEWRSKAFIGPHS